MKNYFTPPKELVESGATEGEAIITWVKEGDKFLITSIEGSEVTEEPMTAEDELRGMM